MSADDDRIFMQYLIFSVEQKRSTAKAQDCLGAKVGCWIKDRTADEAFITAKHAIEGNGWNILALEDQYPVSELTYAIKPEGAEYYDQALIDSEVFVFFTHPKPTSS